MTEGDHLLARTLRSLPATAGTVDRATVGEGLLMVELSTGGDSPPRPRAGVAHRPRGDPPAVEGRDAAAVARWSFDPPPNTDRRIARALGIAALNALSAPHVDWQRGDPMARLADEIDAIATVGLFRPAFRKFDALDVRVVERDPPAPASIDAPADVTVRTFAPDEAAAAFDGVAAVFVTGSALVYGGLDAYLRAAAGVPTVVLIGATASFLPTSAFEAGVTMLAGARVTDPGTVRRGISRGLCATDLHDRGLEKVYVAAAETPGIELTTQADHSHEP